MKTKKLKVISGIILSIVTLVLLGLYLVDFVNDSEGRFTDIMMWFIIILAWFQFATWGNDSKAQKDEMGQEIRNKSGKISYYILTVFLFVFWIADNLINQKQGEFGNIFLFSTLCLAVLIFPISQFLVARKITKE